MFAPAASVSPRCAPMFINISKYLWDRVPTPQPLTGNEKRTRLPEEVLKKIQREKIQSKIKKGKGKNNERNIFVNTPLDSVGCVAFSDFGPVLRMLLYSFSPPLQSSYTWPNRRINDILAVSVNVINEAANQAVNEAAINDILAVSVNVIN
jgi:hypothetical protein